MGATYSSSEMTNVMKVMNQVIMSTVQECVVDIVQDQSVNAANRGFQLFTRTSVEQSTGISNSCFSNSEKQLDLQNNLIAALKNYSTATGLGVLGIGTVSVSQAVTNMETNIRNSIQMQNIQRNYTRLMQRQGVDFTNYGVQIATSSTAVQGAEVFAQATMEEIAKTSLLTDIKATLDQQATSTTANPLEALANLLGSFGMAIFGVIAAVIFVFVIMGSMGGGGGSKK